MKPSSAKTALQVIEDELQQIRLRTFNSDFVWQLGARIRESAALQGYCVAIEIRHGTDIVFATLVGRATSDNFDWTRRKCAVVHRFHRSSLAMKLEAQEKGYDFNTRFRLSPADYAASGGGVPLFLDGDIFIGSVGVSGLPDVEDHRIIVDSIRQVLG